MFPSPVTLLLLVTGSSVLLAVDISQCMTPLGMADRIIPDEDITASSSFNSGNVGPQNARLKVDVKGGAWCPKIQITTETMEWLEIDLHTVHVITGCGTQGRFGNGVGQEYAEAYVLEYWRPKLGKWIRYRSADGLEVLTGNTNTYLENKNNLEPPIWASKIRFLPYSSHRRTVCMRVELYGCYWSMGVVAYSAPKGDKRSNGIELTDTMYDGQWGDVLHGGIGQLVDGQYGGDEIREAAKNSAWVGWRNDSHTGPLIITFEFDKVREFNVVHLFCNNRFMRDVQIFSEAIISFSIGGRRFQDEPICYVHVEDHIFETSRNISIKLHHRIGKWVRIELHFSARWILISEIVFESDVAQGNYTPEDIKSVLGRDNGITKTSKEVPMSTTHKDDPLYIAIVVGVFIALVILFVVAIFLIVNRHQHRKCYTTPHTDYVVSYKREGPENYSRCGTSSHISTLPVNKLSNNPALDIKSDEYQEPYEALECAPLHFSHGKALLEMKEFVNGSNQALSDGSNYDYAVPDLSSTPILSKRPHLLEDVDGISDVSIDDNIDEANRACNSSNSSGRNSHSRLDMRPQSRQEIFMDNRRRLECNTQYVVDFPIHRLKLISKLAEGAFGTVYVAEADSALEYNGTVASEEGLVAVKFLSNNATINEREKFERDVRILSALSSPQIARVLGKCRTPMSAVIMEYLEYGDLCAFLRTSAPPTTMVLFHMVTQIAVGMQYLESLSFVHRDLAARNCIVGKGYQVKICDFGTDNDIYACDYYKVDGLVSLPIRWAAWESVFLGKFTTKTDVWSFAVTLNEILSLCQHTPYEHMTNAEVLENLSHLHIGDGVFDCLDPPDNCPQHVYDLMCECWNRDEFDRPTFREINLILQTNNMNYT